MGVEFGASIVLKSESALNQMKKFANETSKASNVLKGLQAEVKAASQGLGANTFKKYVDSSRKLTLETKKNIAAIHDQTKTYSKLSDEQKELIASIDKLNQKYSESARHEAQLIRVKKELQQITGAGLQTKKEEIIAYKRISEEIRKSSTAYKTEQAALKKANELRRSEAKNLRDLRMKYDKVHSVKVRERKAQMELNKLMRAGTINGRQYSKMLAEQKKRIEHNTSAFQRMASAQSAMAKAARLVSIYSRVLLGLYAAGRIAKSIKDFEQMAEKIQLLSDKLTFLTGDSGAYAKLFKMTQDVGIEMKAADKIITRFAVVTNRAFSIDTMNEWSATLIKSARATGTSTQEMSGALIQITQAMSAGRLMGDEYRSVTENLPLLTVALRDMFGKSTLSLKELSSQGLITNDVMIDAFGRLKTLLEGFPDSTDTIEASIGRLSSAWANFTYEFSEKPIIKDILEYTTDFINRASRHEKTNKLNRNSAELKSATDGLREAQERVRGQEKFINELWEDLGAKENTERFKNAKNKLTWANERLGELNKVMADREEALRKLTGNDKATAAKDAADAATQAERELNRIYKEELKTLRLIEKLQKGKSIETIDKNLEFQKNELRSKLKLYDQDEAGGISLDEFDKYTKLAEENAEELRQKVYKREVDAHLRLNGFKTKFNLEEIQDEITHTSKLLEIQKKYNKRKLEIESGMEARKEGLKRGLKGEALSKFTEEAGNQLLADLETKRAKDTADEITSITNSINKMTAAAEKASMTIKRDSLGLLSMEQKGILSKFDKSIQSLDEYYKRYGELSGDQIIQYNLEARALSDLRDLEIENSERKLNEGLEDKFSSQTVALRKYEQSVIDLNVAKERMVVTDKEYTNSLREINLEYDIQVLKTQSLNNELDRLDQAYQGMKLGAQKYMIETQTMAEFTMNATETFMDGTIDLILDQTKSGEEAFKAMISSMLRELAKLAIKQSIMQSFYGISFGGGATTTTNAAAGGFDASAFDTYSVNANGNVFSGKGISAYSGTTVSKPTLFPFAKGIGMMGEAGAEAILPLERGSNGKLGVKSSGGGASVTVNNYSSSEIETKTSVDSNGKEVINIMVREAINGMVQNGQFDSMMTPYNITRKGVR